MNVTCYVQMRWRRTSFMLSCLWERREVLTLFRINQFMMCLFCEIKPLSPIQLIHSHTTQVSCSTVERSTWQRSSRWWIFAVKQGSGFPGARHLDALAEANQLFELRFVKRSQKCTNVKSLCVRFLLRQQRSVWFWRWSLIISELVKVINACLLSRWMQTAFNLNLPLSRFTLSLHLDLIIRSLALILLK